MTYTLQYPESVLCDLACMILSNITAHTTPCVELLKLEVEITPTDDKGGYYTPQSRSVTAPPPAPYPSASTKSVPALPLLVDAFATATTEGSKRKGQLHFLGSVFANLSIVSFAIGHHSSITEEKEYRHLTDGGFSCPPIGPFLFVPLTRQNMNMHSQVCCHSPSIQIPYDGVVSLLR